MENGKRMVSNREVVLSSLLNLKNSIVFLVLFGLIPLSLRGQSVISLLNPSFEVDAPRCGDMPAFWINRTSKVAESDNPTIAPGCNALKTAAAHGERYICLKTRLGGNNDHIGQRLNEGAYLQQDSAYRMHLFLAYSKEVAVLKPNGKKGKSYGKPAALRVWGVSHTAKHKELLAETLAAAHTDWRRYELILMPTENTYDEILLEAHFDHEQKEAYRGNVLIDSISPIVLVSRTLTKGEIVLKNPSLEGEPKCCTVPPGWTSCGGAGESPPDIQPGVFLANTPAAHGKTYVGMVVRDNNTVEAIGQRISSPLEAGGRYALRISLARSEMYLSLSRMTGNEANYTKPVVLRVWGSRDSLCERNELLYQTPPISTPRWQGYELLLSPQKDTYNYLLLEAYYQEPKKGPYNGNILIDNVSLHKIE